MSASAKQKQLDKKKKKREEKKLGLMKQAEKRIDQRGAPDFGMKEGDFLNLKNIVQQLTVSNNNIAAEIDAYRKFEMLEKAKHNNWMLAVLLQTVADAGVAIGMISVLLHEKEIISDSDFAAIDDKIPTTEKINQMSRKEQEKGEGLIDKSNGQVEAGDVIIMNFVLFDENDAELQRESGDSGYTVGSKGLPEQVDAGLLGMGIRETRMFDGVIFEKGQVKEGLEGKELRMQVTCRGIKTLTKASA